MTHDESIPADPTPLSSLGPVARSRLLPNTPVTLLQRIRQARDPAAWADLVTLLGPLVDLWVARTVRDANDRADVGQEVFLELARRLPTWDYDPARSFRGWLRTVARTKCADLYRKRGRVAAPADRPAPDEPDRLDGDETAVLLRAALGLLRSQVRADIWDIFRRHVLEEGPARVVADDCGVEVNYVYLVRSRLMARLRGMVENVYG